ncbi:hypothetical protein HYQ44_010868 [Verticillium longisporum]|nr:hypothetical protein HYQ44_010868 [Verticillium longisporum]
MTTAALTRSNGRRKLDPRSHIGYLCGYDSTNIYRIWVPQLKKVLRTRDVTFDESTVYKDAQSPEPAVTQELFSTLDLPITNDVDPLGNATDIYEFDLPTKLFPKEILIRSDIHNTTKIHGKYQKDPKGPHATLCYKDQNQVESGTHVASHGYVRSMADWTYVSATHHPEKPDSVKKANRKDEIWPPSEDLREITAIAYCYLAEFIEHWAEVSENSVSTPLNQTAYDSLAAATALMTIASGSSQAGAAENQEPVFVDMERDTYVVVDEKAGNTFKLRLLDRSTIKTQVTGWQLAHVWFEEDWTPCHTYVGQKSGIRYWTWTMDQEGKEVAEQRDEENEDVIDGCRLLTAAPEADMREHLWGRSGAFPIMIR